MSYFAFGLFRATAPSYRQQDTFTDANGTAILSHTPDVGPSWSVISGLTPTTPPTIQSNKLSASANSGQGGYYANVSAADVTLQLTGRPGINNCHLGFIFRYTNSTNYWKAFVWPFSGASQSTLEFSEVNGGTTTQRAWINPATNFSPTADITVVLVLSGTSLTFTAGTDSTNYTSSFNQTATRHGFYYWPKGATFTIDDYTAV